MKTLTVKINEVKLRELLTEQIKIAENFEWTGWRIPIYLEEDGSCSAGGWLSQSSYQPDAHELPIKIETWSMSDLGYDDGYSEWDKDFEVDELVDSKIKELEDYYDEDHEYELI